MDYMLTHYVRETMAEFMMGVGIGKDKIPDHDQELFKEDLLSSGHNALSFFNWKSIEEITKYLYKFSVAPEAV